MNQNEKRWIEYRTCQSVLKFERQSDGSLLPLGRFLEPAAVGIAGRLILGEERAINAPAKSIRRDDASRSDRGLFRGAVGVPAE